MQPGSTYLTLQALASLKIVLNARDHMDPLLSELHKLFPTPLRSVEKNVLACKLN